VLGLYRRTKLWEICAPQAKLMLFVTTVSLAINICKIGKSSNVGQVSWVTDLLHLGGMFHRERRRGFVPCRSRLLCLGSSFVSYNCWQSPQLQNCKTLDILYLVPLCLKKFKQATYDYSTNLHSRQQSEEIYISDVPMMQLCCIIISFTDA
jgi:hypothetical protein